MAARPACARRSPRATCDRRRRRDADDARAAASASPGFRRRAAVSVRYLSSIQRVTTTSSTEAQSPGAVDELELRRGAAARRLTRCVPREQILDPGKNQCELRRLGQAGDTEVGPVRYVETRAGGDQNVFLLEQVKRELLVIEARQSIAAHADERIHRTQWRRELEKGAARHRVDDRPTRFVQTSSGCYELANALVAAQRRLHGPLCRHVAAQTQRRQQLEPCEVLA